MTHDGSGAAIASDERAERDERSSGDRGRGRPERTRPADRAGVDAGSAVTSPERPGGRGEGDRHHAIPTAGHPASRRGATAAPVREEQRQERPAETQPRDPLPHSIPRGRPVAGARPGSPMTPCSAPCGEDRRSATATPMQQEEPADRRYAADATTAPDARGTSKTSLTPATQSRASPVRADPRRATTGPPKPRRPSRPGPRRVGRRSRAPRGPQPERHVGGLHRLGRRRPAAHPQRVEVDLVAQPRAEALERALRVVLRRKKRRSTSLWMRPRAGPEQRRNGERGAGDRQAGARGEGLSTSWSSRTLPTYAPRAWP